MNQPRKRIYVSVPHMGGNELRYVQEAFETNWISTVGPNVTAFERAIQERVGLPALALSSCTAAIHLALRLVGVAEGDEVFSPSLTFIGGVNPILYLGAKPVFLDSDARSWNLDPNVLEEALKAKAARKCLPRALIVTHLFGRCADMDPILELCGRYGIPVVEDAAEALGARYRGRSAGVFGEVGTFSFNGNKILTTSGGGVLVSRNEAWVSQARYWSRQARDAGSAFEHSDLGYNYAMSNVLAGIGRGQMELLDQRVQQRRAVALRYRSAFADIQGVEFPRDTPAGFETCWLSTVLIDETRLGVTRDSILRALEAHNIEARPVFLPMHLQKPFLRAERFGGAVSEDVSRRGICLPSSSSLSAEEQDLVIAVVRETIGASGENQTANRGCIDA
jgi:pyridoxal phosphate-dependent aminotransferase EpsN